MGRSNRVVFERSVGYETLDQLFRSAPVIRGGRSTDVFHRMVDGRGRFENGWGSCQVGRQQIGAVE